MVKGYPEEKLMFDRIVHAVKRFQALWRGYIYKKAYPIARRQARAAEAININKRVTLSTVTSGDRAVAASAAEHKFLMENRGREGSNTAILFDRGRKSEAIYSCEIVRISGEHNGVYVYVRFH